MRIDDQNQTIESDEIEADLKEFYRSDLLLPKITKVFKDRKKRQGKTSKVPKRIRTTLAEERIVKHISNSTGFSEDQICYYFFHVGMKKEAERDADKFDLTAKVRDVYSGAIKAEFEKFRAEHLALVNQLDRNDREMLGAIYKNQNLNTRLIQHILFFLEMLKVYLKPLTNRLEEYRHDDFAFADFERRAELKAIESARLILSDETKK
jgi:hypothetical protein